jgi:alkylation response protein AidB-like acyl-CoA dehydrogenase
MTLAVVRPPARRGDDPQPDRWHGPYLAAVELDADLGDPNDAANPYGFAAWSRRDEAAAFPHAIADRVGPALRRSFVPAEFGGTLTGFDETLAMVRIAARRDATVMPATMFSITATTCVLLAGNANQKAEVVRLLAAGEAIGFAMSEPDHGSDLLANECRLTPAGEGWQLCGDKWLVGLGERAAAVLVVARSGERGPGAFSAVLLRKDDVDHSRLRPTPKTAGMRGIDFAAFRFGGGWVSGRTTVGARGRGLETAMKAMQVVRAMSTGCNVACADTGLRLTMDFANRHLIAGRRLIDQPHAQRELGTAAAALVACDVVALSVTRALHTLPGSQSVWSSVAKKVLTDLSEEVFARCADVLGTRGLLHDGPQAAFDAARRDNAVVRYIDTGPVANLRLIGMQLRQLAPAWESEQPISVPELAAVNNTFALGAPLPPLRLAALELSVRGREPVTAAFAPVARAVRATLGRDVQADRRLAVLLNRVEHGLGTLHAELSDPARKAALDATALIELAERLCYLHAAASCVHLWWANRALPCYGAPAGSTGWLLAALALLVDRADGCVTRLGAADAAGVFDVFAALHAGGRLFSAVPLPLAGSADSSGTAVTPWPKGEMR